MQNKSTKSFQSMPFSVFKDVININNSQKAIMIRRILNIKNANQNNNSAWTSGTQCAQTWAAARDPSARIRP